jgi:hypothetical protein
VANFIIDTDPVLNGLIAALVAALAPQKVGDGVAPENVLDAQNRLLAPYVIVYGITSPVFGGSLAHPEEMAGLQFQVTSVGGNRRSALIMRDRVSRAILGRTASGAFEQPITTGSTVTVIDRRVFEYGTPEAVQNLWQVPDTYVLEVQAHA